MWLIALPDIDIYQCDQAIPACGQRIKPKRNCPGYRDEADLMFLDETRMVVKKAQTRSPPRAAEDGFFEEGTSSVSVPPPWAGGLEGTPLVLSPEQPIMSMTKPRQLLAQMDLPLQKR